MKTCQAHPEKACAAVADECALGCRELGWLFYENVEPRWRRGSHWAVTAAWDVLDLLPPGTFSREAHYLLLGAISAKLIQATKRKPE